jgi:hypothetical protein
MSRTTSVVVVLIFGLVLVTESRADDPKLTLGEKYEGELEGETKLFLPTATFLHQANLQVMLKAGQTVSIQAKVLGAGRKVALALHNKTGKGIGGSPLSLKSTTFKLEEAPYTGNYTVVVASDQVGAFTVVVSIEEELSDSEIDAKIEALKQELKKLEKLKETRSKKSP